MVYSMSGLWEAKTDDEKKYTIHLPGTLDENEIGKKDNFAASWHPDVALGNADDYNDISTEQITTRLTRKFTYEGSAIFTRKIDYKPSEGKRVFIDIERARCLRLKVDGKEVPHYNAPSLSTPHTFEVTNLLNGNNEIIIISDNSYIGLPHDAIVFSSMASDETQTNWNGILGFFKIREEERDYVVSTRVYPKETYLDVEVEIDTKFGYKGKINICSEVFVDTETREISISRGKHRIVFDKIKVNPNVKLWDEYEGNIYEVNVLLSNGSKMSDSFGIRTFGYNSNGRITLNDRTIFLRSETNCAVFPETGYAPMDVERWEEILQLYKEYGVNCVRFHSYCPPKAAFMAADKIGMMMMPELSHWNPQDAFDTKESFEYYKVELTGILQMLTNHPSFVMLSLGNELQFKDRGQKRAKYLLDLAREIDGTRLYTNGSNVFYAMSGCDPNSDFYTSQGYYKMSIRGSFSGMPDENEVVDLKGKLRVKGYINSNYPNAKTNYNETMVAIREAFEKPVFSFEAGQYEVLPDFREIEEFNGVTIPNNLKVIERKVSEEGMMKNWIKYVEATGELSRIGYREEVEAVMRTEGLSGISLLGLQDFPGQGTALVGMLNSHLKPKPYEFSRPELFQEFFRSEIPLVLLPQYTYEVGEVLEARVKMANYGKSDIVDQLRYEFTCEEVSVKGELSEIKVVKGSLSDVGLIRVDFCGISKPSRAELKVYFGKTENTYPLWIYPPVKPKCPDSVYETETFDEDATKILEAGGKVLLSPPATKEALPNMINTQFTTDFWSVGTFPFQEGTMGQYIETSHPIFKKFPTEVHTNWQWWPMATTGAVIIPKEIKAIITEMDSYAYMRRMAQLFECKCGKGKLIFSSMGLQDIQEYPEARALLDAIYIYMDSEEFIPEQVLSPYDISHMEGKV
ncbi:MAG: glycoside hydrolase family 2 TIM barrel-domain containing protein [Suipraeoptans sp.]